MFFYRNCNLRGLLPVVLATALLVFCGSVAAQTPALLEINRLLKAGQAQVALDRVNVYLTSNSKDAAGRFIRGLAQAELGKTDDAIMTFQALIEDFPELPEPYNNLAVLYSSKGQFEQARVALELAIQTHPSYSTAYENLGDIYARLASQAYDKALQLDKGNGAVSTKLNLVRELFSTNPKANTAPRAPTAAVGMTSAPVANATNAPPATPRPPASAVASLAAAKPVAPAATLTATPALAVATEAAAPAVSGEALRNVINAEVLTAVNKWAKDWAEKNPDGYLAAYAKSFKPQDGSSRATWNALRRERITASKRIKVEVLGATVEMTSATEAKVTFLQAYDSDTQQTRSRKTLTLVKEGGAWVITRERVG